jgi:two-component system response regulator
VSGPAEVLLVDDDRNDVDVALRALDRDGLEARVTVARDGLEALQALGLEDDEDARPARPKVVFLDIKMPRVDGWEVLRRMREDPRTADVPVVVMSGSDRPEDVRRSYALGANSFVLKRFDPRGPARYFVEAVRYWIGLNHTPWMGR